MAWRAWPIFFAAVLGCSDGAIWLPPPAADGVAVVSYESTLGHVSRAVDLTRSIELEDA